MEQPNQLNNYNNDAKSNWFVRKTPFIIVSILLFVLITAFLWQRITITIPSGQAGILFHRFKGTQIDRVYTEGFHLINPFNTMYLYEIRKQVKLHDFSVLTNKGLHIKISLAIRYQPVYPTLGLLHQQVGPDYVSRIIISSVESVIRKRLGQHTAEEIYTNKKGLLTKTILLALEEVGRNYINVEDIIIRSIELPEKVKIAIENKLTEEELLKTYVFKLEIAKQEAERKKIEAEGIRGYQSIIEKSLSEKVLQHQGILATEKLAASKNSKIIVIGSGKNGLPIILGGK